MRRLLRPALVLAATAVAFRVDPVLGAVVLLSGWAVSSWVLPPRRMEGLTGRRTVVGRALFGEEVTVRLEVTAAHSVPWLHLTDVIPFDLGPSTRWVTSVEGNGSAVHEATLVTARRGVHRIGPAVVTIGDPFGLRRVQRTLVPPSELLVYPRIVPMEALTVAAGSPLPLHPARTPLFADPTRIVGVRPYEPGDPLRSIHWTASASTGDLLVKKHRPGISRDVMLLVDLDTGSHPAPGRRRSAELAVTAAASVVHHLVVDRREAVGIRIAGRDAPTGAGTVVEVTPGRDESRMTRILEHLARSELTPSADLEALLDPTGLPFGASVVMLTGRPVRFHLLEALRLMRRGIAVTVVVTASHHHRDHWEHDMRQHGVAVRNVSRLSEVVGL